MEFSFYGRILRRWLWLIALGTLLALAVGVAVEYQSRIAASSSYQAKSTLTINCVSPGCAYVAGVSVSGVENGLISHVNDPAATQISPRVPGPTFSSLTAFIDPSTGTLTVEAIAPTRLDAMTAANLASRYLAAMQNARVRQASAAAIANYRGLANHAKSMWLRYVRLLARTPS